MGAAESTDRTSVPAELTSKLSSQNGSPSLPLPVPRDHPLYLLLQATPTPPTDPEEQFYHILFSDFISVSRSVSQPLAPLVKHALNDPTSRYAVAVSVSFRAAIHHLRQMSDSSQFGALHFARSMLADLRHMASSPTAASLAIAAGPAEAQLAASDRIDLARSLRANLVLAVLDIIPHGEDEAVVPPILSTAIPLLLLALTDDSRSSKANMRQMVPPIQPYYSDAPRIVVALLNVISVAAPHTRPTSLLAVDVRPSLSQPKFSPDVASVWDAWDVFTTSNAAVNLRNGFADVVSALGTISQRLKIPVESSSRSRTSVNSSSAGHSTSSLPNMSFDQGMSPKLSSKSRSPSANMSNSTHSDNIFSDGSNEEQNNNNTTLSQISLAEQALVLLCFLCQPLPNNSFVHTICELRDATDVRAEKAAVYPFSRLYEAMGRWIASPRATIICYYLLVRNRSFRTFALARTDPDVLLAPLLASLRTRCVVGAIPADAYTASAILLVLSSDVGFCEAIDNVGVPETWLPFIADRVRVGGDALMLSGAVLIVCARVVQQSLVIRRQYSDSFLSSLCLAVMNNVAGKATNIHPFVAERVVSLVEFLGRRRKRALPGSTPQGKMPKEPPRVRENNNEIQKRASADMIGGSEFTGCPSSSGRRTAFVQLLSQFIGMSLDVVIRLLRAKSTVAANCHLVYALMHHESALESDIVSGSSVKAHTLMHMIGRMVHFFSEMVDTPNMGEVGRQRSNEKSGVSVEKVFRVIQENARFLERDIFAGVPDTTFSFQESEMTDKFFSIYGFSMLRRHWWGLDGIKEDGSEDVINVFRISQ